MVRRTNEQPSSGAVGEARLTSFGAIVHGRSRIHATTGGIDRHLHKASTRRMPR